MSDDNGQNNSTDTGNDERMQRLIEQVSDAFTRVAEGLARKEAEIAEKLQISLDKQGHKELDEKTVENTDADRIIRDPYYNSITDPRWKLNKAPVLIGEHFVIANSWRKDAIKNDEKYAERKLIQIDPGVAFGNFHETTKVCVSGLEQYWRGGRMLDVGTGTGVLSMVAHHLYPDAQFDAFDISATAVEHAQISLQLNNLTEKIALRQATIDQYPAGVYDLVVANLLPDIILNMQQELIARLKPGGLLLLSGIRPNSQDGVITALFDWGRTTSSAIGADQIAEIFAKQGLEKVDLLQKNNWAVLILRAPVENKGINNG